MSGGGGGTGWQGDATPLGGGGGNRVLGATADSRGSDEATQRDDDEAEQEEEKKNGANGRDFISEVERMITVLSSLNCIVGENEAFELIKGLNNDATYIALCSNAKCYHWKSK